MLRSGCSKANGAAGGINTFAGAIHVDVKNLIVLDSINRNIVIGVRLLVMNTYSAVSAKNSFGKGPARQFASFMERRNEIFVVFVVDDLQ